MKSDFVKEFWWGVQTCLVQVIVFLLSFLTMTGPVDHLEVSKERIISLLYFVFKPLDYQLFLLRLEFTKYLNTEYVPTATYLCLQFFFFF